MNLPVPTWVDQCLAVTGAADVARYESSIYGPLNAFLTSYFPPHQTFMVKPQAKIRPHYEEVPMTTSPPVAISGLPWIHMAHMSFPELSEGGRIPSSPPTLLL